MEFTKRNPHIYVLSGKAGSGKNLTANLIKDIYYKKGKKVVNLAYASYLKGYAMNVLGWDGNEDTKPREFLQQVGVELIKNQIDDHMLIDRLVEDAKVYSYFYDVITVSDARFEDEITCMKDNFDKVTVIRITTTTDNKLTNDEKKHLTEIALDNYHEYDYELENNSSVYDMRGKLEKIIDEVDEDE